MAEMNKKSLAAHYGLDPRTLNKYYELWQEKIGPYIAKRWTPKQVKTWKELFSNEGIEEVGKD